VAIPIKLRRKFGRFYMNVKQDPQTFLLCRFDLEMGGVRAELKSVR
jgi:hypothetical protein